ncbi:T9SS type A sorting domain-containing protein [bacterium]|nr:T9SS type A sorting domain-containing protein [bacterium]
MLGLRRKSALVLGVTALGGALALPGRSDVLDWHPLFGQDIIGNRAEIVTLGRTDADSVLLHSLDFASDALVPHGSAVPCTLGAPAGFAEGLVAYWNFDEDCTATFGGPAFDGVATGVDFDASEGRFGGSALFERANADRILINTPVVAQHQDHTFSVWYRERDGNVPAANREVVLETFGPDPNDREACVCNFGVRDPEPGGTDQLTSLVQWEGGSYYYVSESQPTPQDLWNNITVTYDWNTTGYEHALYWNGVLMDTWATSHTLLETAGLTIGGTLHSSTRWWDGWIDDLAFWNRMLTPQEIAALQTRPVLGPYPTFQELDAVSADFDRDGRDEVLMAYGRDTEDPLFQEIWFGSSRWTAPGSTTWTPYRPAGSPMLDNLYVHPSFSGAAGNLRLVAGNFDEDEAPELAMIQLCMGSPHYWRLQVFDVDDGVPVVKSGFLFGDLGPDYMRESMRFALAAGDMDGDAIDELVVAWNHRDLSGTYRSLVNVYRYDPDGGEFASVGQYVPYWGWTPDESFGHNVNQNNIDRLAVSVGRHRNDSAITPFIAFGTGTHFWGEDRTFGGGLFDLLLLRVDTNSSSWGITLDSSWGNIGFEEWVPVPQADWHTTSQSFGVDAGDLDFDGIDEVVVAGKDSVYVFDVTGTSADLMLERRAVHERTSRLSDPSHRVVQIVDLDASATDDEWRPEILVQDWVPGSPDSRRLRVLRPALTPVQTDPDTLWQVDYLYLVDESAAPGATPGSVLAVRGGDLDGDAYRIVGDPEFHGAVADVVPIVILNAPPIHFDVMPPDTFDLSGCIEGPTCNFVATYFDTSSTTNRITTEFHRDWGLGEELKASTGPLGKVGLKLEASLELTYGRKFSRVSQTDFTIGSSVQVQAWDEDQILLSELLFDIYEYDVTAPAEADTGHIVIVVPTAHNREWVSSTKYLDDYLGVPGLAYRLPHEVTNVLSYAPENGLGVSSNDMFDSATWNIGPSGSSAFTLTWTQVTESNVRTEEEFGVAAEGSAGAAGSAVTLKGDYGERFTNAVKNTVMSGISIKVEPGTLASGYPSDAGYGVTPIAFWRDGALVVDYEVEPEISGSSTTWWEGHYDRPDPALNLPNRYRNPTDPVAKLFSPGITTDPTFAHVGETVQIAARVHNYSLVDLDQAVGVDFYLGNPDSGGIWIGCDSTDAIAARGMQEVSIEHMVAPSAPDTVRVFVVLDVGTLDQIHTNNDRGSVLLRTDGGGAGVDAPVVAAPLPFALHQNAPNPFGGDTRITFSLPERTRTSLRIYDVSGRLVRTLVDADVPAGAHEFPWNGLDGGGSRVASGVYFYRLESGAGADTRKMVQLR